MPGHGPSRAEPAKVPLTRRRVSRTASMMELCGRAGRDGRHEFIAINPEAEYSPSLN
jgi:hypothetical protein